MRASELSTAMTTSIFIELCRRVMSSPFLYEQIRLWKQSYSAPMRDTDLQQH